MLEIQGLSKSYDKHLAVNNVYFTIPEGKVGILLGANGAGKSTIIKSIAGLLRYQGEIRIQNMPARSMEAKKVFGYVPELPYVFDALTIAEHVEFVRKAYRSDITDQEVDGLFRRFDLMDKLDKLGSELSKGMKQKVSICCALAIRPKVVLLDEPMVGLDPKAIKELKEVVLEFKLQGTTVLMSTHMLEMVKELWDVMLIMEKGHLTHAYSKDQIGEKELEEIFFELTGGDAS